MTEELAVPPAGMVTVAVLLPETVPPLKLSGMSRPSGAPRGASMRMVLVTESISSASPSSKGAPGLPDNRNSVRLLNPLNTPSGRLVKALLDRYKVSRLLNPAEHANWKTRQAIEFQTQGFQTAQSAEHASRKTRQGIVVQT